MAARRRSLLRAASDYALPFKFLTAIETMLTVTKAVL